LLNPAQNVTLAFRRATNLSAAFLFSPDMCDNLKKNRPVCPHGLTEENSSRIDPPMMKQFTAQSTAEFWFGFWFYFMFTKTRGRLEAISCA
jgi:hypothetical protein